MLNIFFSSKLLKILTIAIEIQINSSKTVNLPDDSELFKDQNKVKSLTLNTSKVNQRFSAFLSHNKVSSKNNLINYELLLKTYINAFVNRKHILEEIRKINIKGFGSSLEGIDRFNSFVLNTLSTVFPNFNFSPKTSSKTKNIFLKNLQILKFQLNNLLLSSRECSIIDLQVNVFEIPFKSKTLKNYKFNHYYYNL